jgi:hypothetical protein
VARSGDPGEDDPVMARRDRSRIGRLVLALLGVWALLAAQLLVPSTSRAVGWSGGMDLYRSGTFTTQRSWLWCTAADIQLIRNLVRHEADHSTNSQRASFRYMRAHNRYDIPVSDGVDPAGWAAGLRHYVDSRYRLVSSSSFDAALRSAVTNLRKTRLPVGITVAHGGHAWVLTGFTATGDPAVTSRFTVTSVRVTGPLWGLQSRSYGYDMKPDTRLTPKQLRGFFTPWHYAGVRMAWEGRWVSIQPIPAKAVAAPAKPTATPKATPKAVATPRPTPTAPPSATPGATPTPSVAASVPIAAEATASPAPATAVTPEPSPDATASSSTTPNGVGPAALAALVVIVCLALGAWRVAAAAQRR